MSVYVGVWPPCYILYSNDAWCCTNRACEWWTKEKSRIMSTKGPWHSTGSGREQCKHVGLIVMVAATMRGLYVKFGTGPALLNVAWQCQCNTSFWWHRLEYVLTQNLSPKYVSLQLKPNTAGILVACDLQLVSHEETQCSDWRFLAESFFSKLRAL